MSSPAECKEKGLDGGAADHHHEDASTDARPAASNEHQSSVTESKLSSKDEMKNVAVAVAAASSDDAAATTPATESKPLSKNQRKRQLRLEKAMERKRRRKQQEKDIKRAKALAEGRDLEEERRLMEERTKSGEGHRRREEKWLQRMKTADASFRVCIDCGYDDLMTPKELNSLANQIRYCYSCNRRSDNPVYLSVANLGGTVVFESMKKVQGFPEQWSTRAFAYSEEPLEEMYPDRSKLVYLTSDSENTLEHLEDDKTYVIGGIVDRNRLKRAAINKAEALGIKTAKLPIADHLHLVTTKVLTCNHVFEILLKYRANGNDWKKAMLDVLPNRKDAQEKEDDADE